MEEECDIYIFIINNLLAFNHNTTDITLTFKNAP